MRGGFGIPHTFDRPNRPAEERFVDLLAGLVKDGLTDAGTKVETITMPVGAPLQATLKQMSEGNAPRYVVIQVLESNWDAGGISGNFRYKYDFGIYVGRRGTPQYAGEAIPRERVEQGERQVQRVRHALGALQADHRARCSRTR